MTRADLHQPWTCMIHKVLLAADKRIGSHSLSGTLRAKQSCLLFPRLIAGKRELCVSHKNGPKCDRHQGRKCRASRLQATGNSTGGLTHQQHQCLLQRKHSSSKPLRSSSKRFIAKDSAPERSDAQIFPLQRWREQPINECWLWGAKGPERVEAAAEIEENERATLAGYADQVLRTADPKEKIVLTHKAWQELRAGKLSTGISHPPAEPSRPLLPKRVSSKEVPSPKDAGVPLNVYLLLTLTHIELNAIDLAWDTVARFSPQGLPKEFYEDFAHVADDESRHLGWCLQRLSELSFQYGDIPAHGILWEGAKNSAEELVGRLVVVPCSQEARGLDAGPRLAQRLMSASDHRTAAIVQKISEEELAHVAVGSNWFQRLCQAMDLKASQTFRSWLSNLCPDLQSGNFNHEARLTAGLKQDWYDLKAFPASNEDLRVAPSIKSLSDADLQDVLHRLHSILEFEQR